MNRRHFIGGLALATSLRASYIEAAARSDSCLLQLWPLGDQLVLHDPDLARSLAKTIDTELRSSVLWELNNQYPNPDDADMCLAIKMEDMTIFQGWVLPTDLLRLAVAVRMELGSWI